IRLRFWNSSQSSTLVMIEGCWERPKTSAPRRKTRVATYWFAPLIRLTTAITAATPITTPTSVRTLRSLCAQRLEAEMATASERFIVVGRGIDPGDTNAPHPNIRAYSFRYFNSRSLQSSALLGNGSKACFLTASAWQASRYALVGRQHPSVFDPCLPGRLA